MRKRTIVTLAAIALLLLGAVAVAFGGGKISAASAHSQIAHVQMQSNNQKAGPVQETPEATSPDPAETPGSAESQDQNLPGGGHQDSGQADHQFEGTE